MALKDEPWYVKVTIVYSDWQAVLLCLRKRPFLSTLTWFLNWRSWELKLGPYVHRATRFSTLESQIRAPSLEILGNLGMEPGEGRIWRGEKAQCDMMS